MAEHNWIWKNQCVGYVGGDIGRPYPVDYCECSICGKKTTSAGGYDPSRKGCRGKINNLGPPDFICRR